MEKFNKKKKLASFGLFKALGSFFSYLVKELEELPGVDEFRKAGGLKGIVMAFQGKSASEIELQAIYDRIKKEERVKAQIHEEYRQNH